MCAKYYARNAVMTDADTWYTLNKDGAGNTVNDISLPTNASKIVGLMPSFGCGSTAGDLTVLLKVTGDGVRDGPQTIPVCAACTVGTSIGFMAGPTKKIVVDINVIGGRTITLQAINSGSDTGAAEFGIAIEVI